ncbi:MAG: hypothetical protein QJR12_16770, partial [Mycobacterium sp.]|uniref:hypothetical protein n=1 Tax=Mycobacterium sp. TaxID=1785 RepID=UPI002611A68D
RLLPSLVDDIRKEARGATTRAAAGPSARPSTTDQRVAAAQALKARFASHAVHAIDGATVLQLPSGDMR